VLVLDGTDRLAERHDFINLGILFLICLTIGVYLILTTVLIAKDGVFYIECAQRFTSNPISIVKRHPPGYPFLILIAHKFVTLFGNSSSAQGWIYSAQGITLLCRQFALIPLYLLGKLLVGGKNSFWAILILIFLPYPTRIVCDVVREWPYLLFLTTGFFFLLWGAKYDKWWAFGLVGLSAGLGYLIRPESIQLVVYGILWVMLSTFGPKLWDVSRREALFALALLLIGFAMPTAPYMKCTGRIIPPKVNHIMKSFSFNALPDKTDEPKANTVSSTYNTAEIVPQDVLKALGEIFKTVGENLMWFFVPALVIGLYFHFRDNAKREELLLITAFVLVNVTMMILRYIYIRPHVSQRWSLPLIMFTVFYIPVGLRIISRWLERKVSLNKQKTDLLPKNKPSWLFVLFLIGTCLCLPKLLRPIRIEKQGYRDVAKWLMENTAPADIIDVSDRRISFYAERKRLMLGRKVPQGAGYVVRIMKNEDEELNLGRIVKEKHSVWVDGRKKDKKLVIYKVL
jgi:hypothetical protein